MVVDAVSFKHHVKLTDTVTSYAISITFLVVISLLVLQLFRKCTECCNKYFRKKPTKPQKESVPNKYELLNKQRSTAVSSSSNRSSVCIGSIESYRNAEFEIPGMVSCEAIQPTDSSSASGCSLGGSIDEYNNNRQTVFNDEKFMDEYIQPEPGETVYPFSRTKNKQFVKSPDQRRSTTLDSIALEGQLMPELYQACSRTVQGSSSRGKVMFTLQYEDNSKKRLLMFLHHIQHLKFSKLDENCEQVVVTVTLLPEREYVYKTKEIERSENIKFNDTFTFQSRPRNRDFESRTIVVTIFYICPKIGREIVYGEARLPLLCHEIYSQVVTDVSVGVTSITQNEVGDAQIQISYSSTSQQLTVLLKMVHFTNISLFDKLSGIHIKAYTMIGGEKHGKKKVLSKSIRSNDSHYIEFQEPFSFKLAVDNYQQCTMKMSIHGKHKIMVKHVSLGKVRIGENSPGECGRVHWKTVLASQEIAWTMWHPIYSS